MRKVLADIIIYEENKMKDYSEIKINRDELAELYLVDLKSIKEISRIYKCAYSTIIARLNYYGIKIRDRREVWSDCITKKKLYRLYVVDMISARGIAKIIHCSSTTINNKIRDYGIVAELSESKKKQIKQKRVEERTVIKNSPESKLKQSISMKKAYCNNPKLKENHSEFMLKYCEEHPEEMDEITKNLNAGRNASWKSPKGRQKRMDIINSEEYKIKWHDAMVEMYKEHPELIAQFTERLKIMWQNPEYRDNKLKQLHADRDAAWADPVKKEKWVRNTVKGVRIRPTSIEQTIIDVIKEYDLPYKYVGNGEVIINGKNPDFINTNDAKGLIECFGKHWHPQSDESERIEYFASIGYKTLILWDREIENRPHEEIRVKIANFTDECLKEFRVHHPV